MSYENDIPLSLAVAAHAGTSFTPDKRGEQERSGYASHLSHVQEVLAKHAQAGKTEEKLSEVFDRYRARYRRLYTANLMSKSRIMSTMIAGPSNFPVRRMEKRNNVAHKRLNQLCDFQETGLKAAIRELRPDLAPIMAGDSDAVQRLKADIEKAERVQAIMKECNATIRKHKKAGEAAQVAALVALGHFNEDRARKLLAPDFCGRIGFADFETTNNNANIRRMKARLETISAAKAAPVVFEESESGIKLEDDPPANRVRLIFPGKPALEVRDALKANGFRWAPSSGAWQAYRNHRAMSFAGNLVKKKEPASDHPPLTAYRVHMEDGSSYVTSMAAGVTLKQAQDYFVGHDFTQADEVTKLRAVAVTIPDNDNNGKKE